MSVIRLIGGLSPVSLSGLGLITDLVTHASPADEAEPVFTTLMRPFYPRLHFPDKLPYGSGSSSVCAISLVVDFTNIDVAS